MTNKIRIRLGEMEVEYEGSEDFIRDALLELVSKVADLCQSTSVASNTIDKPLEQEVEPCSKGLQATTNTIAAKMGVNSGPDLIVAAAAQLTIMQGLDSFTRKQLLDEMKKASGYYKKSYCNNLTKYLKTLIKQGVLRETATDTYALDAKKRKELEEKIAQ